MIGLIGKKLGMTQYFKDSGEVCPATAIEVGPCPIIHVKQAAGKDGYNAVKLGFWESEKISKPLMGIAAKAGVPGQKIMGEFRVDNTTDYEAGSFLKADVFEVGEKVMVRGKIKGRGFAGVTKRHGFKGGDATHGCRANRIPGSVGQSSDPSRILKGRKMPGQYGSTNQTMKGLEVLFVDPESNLIYVKGAIPGPRKGIVYISKQP